MAGVLLSDIDGTLVDSNALHAEAWRRAFEHFGIQVGMDETWRQIGKGGDHLIPVFVPEQDRPRIEEELKKFRKELFHRDYMARVQPFPESRALLKKVRESGRRIVLATSSDKKDVATYKQLVGMEDLVEEEASSDDASRSKPEPDIFQAALQKAQVDANQAIALGDTPYDARAAGALGIVTIGLTCGGWKKSDLLDGGCVAVFKDPADLLKNFDHSPLARETA
jgi:HAD superfamily hydrolase (TIGR01509 family)